MKHTKRAKSFIVFLVYSLSSNFAAFDFEVMFKCSMSIVFLYLCIVIFTDNYGV